MNKLYYEMFRSYKTVDMEMFCTFLFIYWTRFYYNLVKDM